MKFENTEIYGWAGAFRGMRNPKESWHLSDSHFGLIDEFSEYDYEVAETWIDFFEKKYKYEIDRTSNIYDELWDNIDRWLIEQGELKNDYSIIDAAFIGPKDMRLAQALVSGGSEHRKFLRQIQVSVDITAPLYWWKEFDTYKVGTTANSTSTMHKLTSKPITLDCFEIDDYVNIGWPNEHNNFIKTELIPYLEHLRLKYLETEDKKYWKELIRWLPESWLQTRTVTMNYENLIAIVHQRSHHKLTEWHQFIDWIKTLPYANELIFNQTAEPYKIFETLFAEKQA